MDGYFREETIFTKFIINYRLSIIFMSDVFHWKGKK